MRARRRLQHRQHQPGEQRGTHRGHIRAHRALRRQLRSDLSQCVPATTSARRVTVHRLPARLTCTLLALPPTAVHCSRGGYCWRCHLSLPRFTRSSSMCRERTAAGPDAPSRAEVGCFQKICDKGAVGTHETPTAPLSQIFWKHPTSHETPTAPLRRERERRVLSVHSDIPMPRKANHVYGGSTSGTSSLSLLSLPPSETDISISRYWDLP